MKKRVITFWFAIFCLFSCMAQEKDYLNYLIPQPTIIEKTSKDSLNINTNKVIIVAPNNCKTAQYLKEGMANCFYDVVLVNKQDYILNMRTQKSIMFVFCSSKHLGKEGYIIDITTQNIIIQANEEAGLFYGVQTLMQLLGDNYCMEKYTFCQKQENFIAKLPTMHIEDIPRFAYRGKHLDCARHFFDIDYLKKYIDLLAFEKINTFHWHLTDDQGWRIEIKKYPLLTKKGSIRKATLIGHYSDNQLFDGTQYGGFYTQEQIKDFVAYCKDRHIEVIPEIELPGHSVAALSAYPNLSCREKPLEVECSWGVFEDVFCSKDQSIEFLEDVLTEVCDLFPSKYIHIGGDETPTTRWAQCDKCKQVMQRENIKDVNLLQAYFTKKITAFLESKNKKVIGWDEILEKGVDTSVTILSWQGEQGAINAAKKGNDAIMAASSYLYFNFYQAPSDNEPLAIGGYTPLKKVYLFEPVDSSLSYEQAKHIIGMQACTWTEYIKDIWTLEYDDLPRLFALAERAWSSRECRDYDNFIKRLDYSLAILSKLGINYSKSHLSLSTTTFSKEGQVYVSLNSIVNNMDIYYTLDGSNPNQNSKIYSEPIPIEDNTRIKAVCLKDGYAITPVLDKKFSVNKATGKDYTLLDINPSYNAMGQKALTDGICGNKQSFDKWIGTLGRDYNVIVDLEKTEDIHMISINFLDEQGSWIFLPQRVMFFVSQDTSHWTPITPTEQIDPKDNSKIVSYQVKCNTKARYVKIFAKSIGLCPENHPGKGYAAHLFSDEIKIY